MHRQHARARSISSESSRCSGEPEVSSTLCSLSLLLSHGSLLGSESCSVAIVFCPVGKYTTVASFSFALVYSLAKFPNQRGSAISVSFSQRALELNAGDIAD